MTGAARDGATLTTCPYCGVGCGVRVDAASAVSGDAAHPANFGKLCSKGSALGDTLGLEGRLLHPMVHGERASWDFALDLVARTFQTTIDEYGPGSVAFYVSGQLLTEDYYVANKLMKGFLGSAAIDTNSRLCMASSVAGHRRAFGEDIVPGCYEDLDLADLVGLGGSNTAGCHPILYHRLTAASTQRGAKVVVIDPRKTATCADASLHLGIAPGTDVLLWNGLLVYLADHGAIDEAYVAAHTTGFATSLAAARGDAPDIDAVAAGCQIARADVETFFQWFAATPRTVSAYSQGVNQSSRGTDKVNAILNCHLATGRIGKPGAGPFSLTGQPNAMGGREVGGLANQLAAHMTFDDPAAIDRVRRFWNAPRMATAAGPKAVDMFEAVHNGQIRAIWIAATNPAVSMPNAGRVREALQRCPLVVVSDCVAETDTAAFAHVLLPAAAWGEKNGTVTNSERRISRQRAFRAPPGEGRPDWWMFAEIGRRMGFAAAFPYQTPVEVFREHARLSAFENTGARLFNIGGLAEIGAAEYESLRPVQWPIPGESKRLLSDGVFPTPDGRGRFIATEHIAPAYAPTAERPLRLNTGRLRDQWHTMSQSGRVARLSRHAPEPCLDVHPDDAKARGLTAGGLVRITSAWGSAIARVRPSEDQAPGSVFLPMHWSDAFSADCVAGRLVNPATDAHSGQPELKHTPVEVTAIAPAAVGFLLTRERFRPRDVLYWTRAKVESGYLYELADTAPDAAERWRALLAAAGTDDLIESTDTRRGALRIAHIADGVVRGCLFAGPPGSLPPREWMLERFASPTAIAADERPTLLSGRAAGAAEERGRIVCSCFSVGINGIVAALRSQTAVDVPSIGHLLRAGTNCGSCIPELKTLVAENRTKVPA